MSINFPTNPDVGTPYSFQGVIWEWNGYGWYIVGSELDIFGLTGSGIFFPANMQAQFGADKSFGKYVQGDTIESAGKTAVTVIQEAMIASLPPTATLTSSSSISFNQTAINNILNFSHTINGFGATLAGATLEFKRTNGTTWAVLSTSTTTPSSYTHSLTDTNFNTLGFDYRYTVSDTNNQSNQATKSIVPTGYTAPSATITLGATTSSPETVTQRELGNAISRISASITRNTPNVQITGWEFIYSRNSGAYQTTGFTSPVAGGGGSISTGLTNHSPGSTTSSVVYKVRIRDEYKDFLGSSYTDSAASSTVNFNKLMFYGPTANAPASSADVRGFTARSFATSTTFVLNSGNEYLKLVAAIPSNKTLVSVFDQTENFFITNSYAGPTLLTVEDFAGNTSSYNVYVLSLGITYTNNISHQHLITTT
jgi:hypothetical protein